MGSGKNSSRAADWAFYTVLTAAYLASLAFIAWYLAANRDYLRLPVAERPFHPRHALLKPGGLYGHGFGIIGSCMLILMHVYTLRKRFKIFRGWGSLKKWLHFHIFLGVIGSLLIIVHSTFKAHGLVALSFWSMVLVFSSGFVGRFFYGAIPRRATGLAFSLDEAEDMAEEWIRGLKARFARIGDAADRLGELESRRDVKRFVAKYVAPVSAVPALRPLSADGLAALRPLWGFSRPMMREIQQYRTDEAGWRYFLKTRKARLRRRSQHLKRVVRTIGKAASLKRKVKRWQSIQSRLYYWHVFHKPLSVVMYIVLFVHVYIAVKFGFVWIF